MIAHSSQVPEVLHLENYHNQGVGKRLVLIKPSNAGSFKARSKVWMDSIVRVCVAHSDMDKTAVVARLLTVLA